MVTAAKPIPALEVIERAIEEAQQGKPRRFIETFLHVRDKRNQIVPFRFLRIVDHADQHHAHYGVYVKPRQVFFTTHELARIFTLFITIPNFQAAIVEHEGEAAERVFRAVKDFYDFLPDGLRPELSADRADYIQIKATKSAIYIGTAGGRRFGRSDTINYLFLDEVAHYTPQQAQELWVGAPEAVPQGGWITVASTPNGVGNLHHKVYLDALAGRTRYQASFYPWFWHEEYTLSPDDPETLLQDRGPLVFTGEEADLVERHGLTDGQVRWRRSKFADKGNDFYQEYPEDDVTCFLATTSTVFPTLLLNQMLRQEAKGPKTKDGPLEVWHEPHPSHQYALGADPAEGLKGGDPTCAELLDCQTRRIVAVVHGQIPVHEFGLQLAALGRRYNNALVVPERNNHGHALILVLQGLGYPRIYEHRDAGAVTKRPGFPTSAASKTQLVGDMKAAITGGDIIIEDKETIRELVEYQADTGAGRYSAPVGSHDDRTVAVMLALHGSLSDPSLSASARAVERRRQVVYYPQDW